MNKIKSFFKQGDNIAITAVILIALLFIVGPAFQHALADRVPVISSPTVISGGGTGTTTAGVTNGVEYNNGTILTNSANFVFDGTSITLASTTAAKEAIATTTTFGAGLALGSQKSILVTEYQPATSTSMTINLLDGNKQLIRMGTSAFTIAFSNALAGSQLRLKICNPNASAGAVTFSDAKILWAGGTIPVQTTTANKCDTWYFDWSIGTSTGSLPTVIDGAQNTF